MKFDDLTEKPHYSELTQYEHVVRNEIRIDGFGNGHKIDDFYSDGYVVINGIVDDLAIDRYMQLRQRENVGLAGWPAGTPYMNYSEIRDICCDANLNDFINELFCDKVGLHLNLTGFVSTERDWHQDTYLNVDGIGSYYVAAWIALDDIHPDSGPFEIAEGSQECFPMTRRKIFEHLSASEQADPNWPRNTEKWVAKACEEKIAPKS